MLRSGERQVSEDLSGIRADHVARYQFSVERAPARAVVYDCGCGVGYGSHLLSLKAGRVVAVDKDAESIEYARAHWSAQNIEYHQGDVTLVDFGEAVFDMITAFEILEHVVMDTVLVSLWKRMLKPGGTLIFSTPDQERYPFAAKDHPFHQRHYSIGDIKVLLQNSRGLVLREHYSQNKTREIHPGPGGRFNIFVVVKMPDAI